MLEKQSEVEDHIFPNIINGTEMDKRALYLPGYPGFRNARDKSGLGYFETRSELAYMQGLMLRWLFTGKFRTHNPIYLFIMFMFGLICGVIPLGVILFELILYSNFGVVFVLLFAFPYIAVGNALFVNTILSFIDWDGKSITDD